MSRRSTVLSLSSVLALLLTVAMLVTPVPYVLLDGGPTFNTTGLAFDGGPQVISITGAPTFPTDGRLDLTTVSVERGVTLGEAVLGWWTREKAVIPEDVIFGDRSEEEIERQNEEQMVTSQSAATTAALLQLGLPVEVSVAEVTADSAAAGSLEVGDQIVAVDGRPVTSPTVLRDLVGDRSPGDDVRVEVLRDGAARSFTLTTRPSGDDVPRAVIGVTSAVTGSDVEVEISLSEVGGPSAGLMFALGIIDKLGEESLTGGRFVAGTGEITAEGEVGPIGGIQQKLYAAGEKGVDVFLVPDANCADAAANAPDGLQLVRVRTLSGALEALQTIQAGGTPEGCAA